MTPTEEERLTIFNVAQLARHYRSRQIKLSQPEATALITDEIITAARLGMSYSEVIEHGCSVLTTDDVMPGVAEMIPAIYVDCLFLEGRHLVSVFDPVRPGADPIAPSVRAGEIITAEGDLELSADRRRESLDVTNTGDRPIQVRSHAHFFEVNKALKFDRERAYGMRLDRPSGCGVRFDPGVMTKVTLVAYAGDGRVFGFNNLTNGSLQDGQCRAQALQNARDKGFIKS